MAADGSLKFDTKIDTDSEGNAVYEYKDITGTVLIAEFRLPDLREKYAALEEEVTNTQLAIVELYEGGEA